MVYVTNILEPLLGNIISVWSTKKEIILYGEWMVLGLAAQVASYRLVVQYNYSSIYFSPLYLCSPVYLSIILSPVITSQAS